MKHFAKNRMLVWNKYIGENVVLDIVFIVNILKYFNLLFIVEILLVHMKATMIQLKIYVQYVQNVI